MLKEIEDKNEEIIRLNSKLCEFEGQLNTLNNELLAIKNSQAWKMMIILKRLFLILIPRNSVRRKLLKIVWKIFLSVKTNISNICFRPKAKCWYPVLHFLSQESPLVSIIIPVYNKFEYTYNCLKSILKNSENINYEVILADDNSSDKTKNINKIVKNIKVIRNKENLGFLRNCNNAVKFANGKYLLFLNNDTRVKKNWLIPLVNLLEQDEKIGMVGSKFVYPNGKLQEAGGIIWRDGSGCNYGHGNDPDKSEFNYVRDVDYISGASILVRRTIWENIGGFDERYTPAYYEDTDLAFSIKEKGYRVVFQPASVVVHFEGITNGADVNNGIKSYQVINQKKFVEKWKTKLVREHYLAWENIFLAKDCCKRKIILVIEWRIPQYDKDAGSRLTHMYLKLFLQLGLKVIFLSEDTYPYQPYTYNLQQMGVEVLYGENISYNWTTWLNENGKFINYVFTCRSSVSIKYIDFLKLFTSAKIIYFNQDMEHLRHYRQYEITGDKKILNIAKDAEKKEMEMSEKADVLYVVGSYEEKILKNLFPQKPVYNIPVQIFEKNDEYFIPPSNRKNLLFVGCFKHPPNEDAVIWFYKNAFLEIVKEFPDIKWYIVGSNPTKKILALNDKHIILTGYVTDEQLKIYYDTCRICIAPLRYGAGVKGKVVEAVYNKIPLITTDIGAEGISLEENAFIVNPPDNTFGKAVIDLYKDEKRMEQLLINCSNLINNHFLISNAINILTKEIEV